MYDKLKNFEKILFDVLAVYLVLYYAWSAVVEPAATQFHRGIYVIITYILCFLLYQSKSKIMRVVDYLLILASIVTVGYWIANFEAINYRTGAENLVDQWMAVVGVLIGVELARRVVGNVFVILGTIFLIYGMYGNVMPDLIAHAGDTLPGLCTSIFYRADGVFGIMANVLATYVLLFVLFGAYLEKCGAQKFFIDWPLAAVGHKIGGPAKVSVIASGLFGSISGSAIANTVSTGTFTIPMMKKAGFRPPHRRRDRTGGFHRGHVHAAHHGRRRLHHGRADRGSPYSHIMLVAIFPALMYFFSVYMMVHWEAKMYNIVGEHHGEKATTILKREWLYTTPLIVITAFMLTGYSPGYSAILGLATCVAISHKTEDTRIDPSVGIIMGLVLLGGWFLSGLGLFVDEAAIASIGKVVRPRFMVALGLIISVGGRTIPPQ